LFRGSRLAFPKGEACLEAAGWLFRGARLVWRQPAALFARSRSSRDHSVPADRGARSTQTQPNRHAHLPRGCALAARRLARISQCVHVFALQVGWVATLGFPGVTAATLHRWRRRALDDLWSLEERPVPLSETHHVHCACPRLGRRLALANFVETRRDEDGTRPSARQAEGAPWTVIVAYRGGTYVSQVDSVTAREALLSWCRRHDPNVFSPAPGATAWRLARRRILEHETEPRAVPGVDRVWATRVALDDLHPAVVVLIPTRKPDRAGAKVDAERAPGLPRREPVGRIPPDAFRAAAAGVAKAHP
jgi:hypothetical protein